MTLKPLLVRFALAAAACVPLAAQTPLGTDGPAFGGSKVFSEGANPLGNPARYSATPAGFYISWVDGDQRAKDNKSILADAASADPAAASAALGRLDGAPWALRTQAFGFIAVKDGSSVGLSRETLNGMAAKVDLAPAHLGAGLAGNTSTLTGRRARVDRLNIGGGGTMKQGLGTGFGADLRVERWTYGGAEEIYNAAGPGAAAFASAEGDFMGSHATSARSWNLGLDGGMVLEVADGVRFGLTGDQLLPKHLWDVYLQPQFRAGLQLDLGPTARLALEGDLNAAQRMPLPVKQQAASVSLRYRVGPSATLMLGAERRKLGTASVTRAGATLQVRTQAVLMAFGFQAGQDRPLKGATLMVQQ
jgi:hypothetical protein